MRTLLLADDSITVQRVIALTFAEEPIQVVCVSDGRQAMEKMASQRPDIVLAGTTLPHVNGYELAAFIRGKPELQRVPVVLLTGAFETVDEAKVASSGASGVIEKPVEPSIVIKRVKELLGLKADSKPALGPGRLITPADVPGDKKLPVATPPRAVTSTRGTPSRWEQLRNQSGLDASTRSVEDSSTRSNDYLESLDDAFDTLDRQLSGRATDKTHPRNPAGPLGHTHSPIDPRSPGRRPADGAPAGNPVFEVDDEWFGNAENAPAAARASRHEFADDLRDPELQGPAPAASTHAIYEVDEAWFADGDTKHDAKRNEHQHLVAEMGVHDVDLPPVEPPSIVLGFGIDDPKAPPPSPPPLKDEPHSAPTPARSESKPEAPMAPATQPRIDAPARLGPAVTAAAEAKPDESRQGHTTSTDRDSTAIVPLPPIAAAPIEASADPPRAVADDFAALLAYETGEQIKPPAPPLQLTEEVLEDLAARVADRLRATMAATMRDTVRAVVGETSERLVREEIERIRNRK